MKIEFSKVIYWSSFLLALSVTIYGCVLMWKTNDTSGLAYLIPAAYAEFSAATGFYFWKARKENEIKLKKKFNIDVTKEDIER